MPLLPPPRGGPFFLPIYVSGSPQEGGPCFLSSIPYPIPGGKAAPRGIQKISYWPRPRPVL